MDTAHRCRPDVAEAYGIHAMALHVYLRNGINAINQQYQSTVSIRAHAIEKHFDLIFGIGNAASYGRFASF